MARSRSRRLFGCSRQGLDSGLRLGHRVLHRFDFPSRHPGVLLHVLVGACHPGACRTRIGHRHQFLCQPRMGASRLQRPAADRRRPSRLVAPYQPGTLRPEMVSVGGSCDGAWTRCRRLGLLWFHQLERRGHLGCAVGSALSDRRLQFMPDSVLVLARRLQSGRERLCGPTRPIGCGKPDGMARHLRRLGPLGRPADGIGHRACYIAHDRSLARRILQHVDAYASHRPAVPLENRHPADAMASRSQLVEWLLHVFPCSRRCCSTTEVPWLPVRWE